MSDTDSLRVGEQKLTVDPVKPLPGGGARLDITAADGRKWRVDVSKNGSLKAVVTTWQDDQLAELETPDWMDDALDRIARAA